ncbi:MAG TPA: polyprenyl synthetase family protein, partial [Actinomycetota bacterium]|nr:polyprenyl synthetase family protein [Actinomycetota bacterium]
ERRRSVSAADPSAVPLVDEIRRLLEAGGKRIRPAFCSWGYRAAGGVDDGTPSAPIVRAAASLELLHTMAIVHDDLLDGAKERRGAPSTPVWFAEHAEELGLQGDPADVGERTAVLVGDLAAVLADRMLAESGFPPQRVVDALAVSHAIRERMAAGEWLDVAVVAGDSGDPGAARRAASLKGGSYTVEGPLLIGAALAGAPAAVRNALRAFGRPLGEAFQLRDDLDDGEAPPGVRPDTVRALVAQATAALDRTVLDPGAADALATLARRIAP